MARRMRAGFMTGRMLVLDRLGVKIIFIYRADYYGRMVSGTRRAADAMGLGAVSWEGGRRFALPP